MKLNPPIEHRSHKLNLVVDGEHLPAFEEYQRYYLETYGKEIDLAEMLVHLAAASVDSDRTFKQWSRQRSCTEHAAQPQ